MTNIEFIEKQVNRLESLIEIAKKCGDESLVREAEKKIEKNKQVIADLKKLEMIEDKNHTKYIVNLVLNAVMKYYGNVYDVIIEINEDLGLDLKPEDYYND